MKTALSLLVILFGIQASYSQGRFAFQNFYRFYGIDAPVFDGEGNRLFGAHYVARLDAGLTQDFMLPAVIIGSTVPQLVTFTEVRNELAGYYDARYYVNTPALPQGQYGWLQVKAWDSRLGATYEDVVNLGIGGYGASPLFYAYAGGIGTPPSEPSPLIGLQSFSLLPVVPEPGVLGFAALATFLGLAFWGWKARGIHA